MSTVDEVTLCNVPNVRLDIDMFGHCVILLVL